MKRSRNAPIPVYVACVILATVFWFVLFSSRMDGSAKNLYVLFLPLTGCPYILWVVHKEGQEPEGYFKDAYGGHAGVMWGVRMFMLVVVSCLSSAASFVIFGILWLVFREFK